MATSSRSDDHKIYSNIQMLYRYITGNAQFQLFTLQSDNPVCVCVCVCVCVWCVCVCVCVTWHLYVLYACRRNEKTGSTFPSGRELLNDNIIVTQRFLSREREEENENTTMLSVPL